MRPYNFQLHTRPNFTAIFDSDKNQVTDLSQYLDAK